MSVLVGLVIGDVAGGLLVTGLGKWVLNSSYSRVAEREADQYAMERLNAAGIDPAGLEAFFVRLSAKRGKSGGVLYRFLSTHPPTGERLAAIRGATRAKGKVFATTRSWTDLEFVCRETKKVAPVIPNYPPK